MSARRHQEVDWLTSRCQPGAFSLSNNIQIKNTQCSVSLLKRDVDNWGSVAAERNPPGDRNWQPAPTCGKMVLWRSNHSHGLPSLIGSVDTPRNAIRL